MRISDWSSDVCSSDLPSAAEGQYFRRHPADLRFVAAADAAYRHPDDGQSRRRRIGVGGFPDPAQPVSRARPATLHGPLWRGHYLLLLLLCRGRLQSRGNRRQSQAPELGHSRYSSGQEHRSEEHTSELQSLMSISYAVFCLKKKQKTAKMK